MTRCRLNPDRGQALVEAALILPILLLVILGGLALGLVQIQRQQLTHAAQQGSALAATVSPDPCPTAITKTLAALGREVAVTCTGDTEWIDLTLTEPLPMPYPGWEGRPTTVTVRTARLPSPAASTAPTPSTP